MQTEHPHIAALKEKHRNLDEEIAKTQARPSSDPLEIARMKREKLALKEEIQAHS